MVGSFTLKGAESAVVSAVAVVLPVAEKPKNGIL